jgi:hypothetical protein
MEERYGVLEVVEASTPRKVWGGTIEKANQFKLLVWAGMRLS